MGSGHHDEPLERVMHPQVPRLADRDWADRDDVEFEDDELDEDFDLEDWPLDEDVRRLLHDR